MTKASNGEELKEGMPVLVRNRNIEFWRYNIFSYYDGNKTFPYRTLDGCYIQCIPYETNKELTNTNKNYKSNIDFRFGAKVIARKEDLEVKGFLGEYDMYAESKYPYYVVFQPNNDMTTCDGAWFKEIEYIEE